MKYYLYSPIYFVNLYNKMKEIYNNIFGHIKDNPIKLTYLAIGGANNGYQQLPPYLIKYITTFNCRIIIIDPCMEDVPKMFTENYLNKELPFIEMIVNDKIKIYNVFFDEDSYAEVITLKYYSNHTNNFNSQDHSDVPFYEKLAEIIINQDCTLIGYDYSGYNNILLQNRIGNTIKKRDLGEHVMKSSSDQIDFLKYNSHILYDTSYGKDLSCLPDLDNKFNNPIMKYENGDLKIYNLENIDPMYFIDYINMCKKEFINDNETLELFNNHIDHCIKLKIKNFNNILYVTFRSCRYKITNNYNDESLTDINYNDDSDNMKEYLSIEHTIITFFKNLSNISKISFDTSELINSMRYESRYKCFEKYFKIILENCYIDEQFNNIIVL